MKQHRVRLTNSQLNFLVKELSEIQETCNLMIDIAKHDIKEAKEKGDAEGLEKAEGLLYKNRRENIIVKDMARKFLSVIQGGRRHIRLNAKICCEVLMSNGTKT